MYVGIEHVLSATKQKLVSEREAARRVGDYGLSDGLRKQILAKGFVLEDTPGGTKVVPREYRPM